MILRVLAVSLVCSALAWSAPTTRPAATSGGGKAATLPTPEELIRRFKQEKQEKEKLPKVAYIDLSKPVVEKGADFALFGFDEGSVTLRSVVERLYQARDDKSVRGVLITLGETNLNLSQAQELRDTLLELKRAGKRTFVYADAYDTAGYTLASGATDVCMLAGGRC